MWGSCRGEGMQGGERAQESDVDGDGSCLLGKLQGDWPRVHPRAVKRIVHPGQVKGLQGSGSVLGFRV